MKRYPERHIWGIGSVNRHGLFLPSKKFHTDSHAPLHRFVAAPRTALQLRKRHN
jgi:hypothetical protein